MRTRGKGSVKRLFTKLVNMFICNVVGNLCPRHWACLVSDLPSNSLALAREPEEKKKPHSEMGSVLMLEVI